MSTSTYYETYWSTEGFCPRGALPPDMRWLLPRAVKPADACLDVGCGDGLTAGPWLQSNGGSYVGADVSRNAVEMARSHGLDAVQIQDAAELPFDDDSFDVALCIEVFEHLFRPDLASREIVRVLRPGGRLIATVPNVSHWKQRVDLALRGRWNPAGDRLSVAQPWRDPHVRFFTPRTLRSMLLAAGFGQVEVGGRRTSVAMNIGVLSRFTRPDSEHSLAAARRFPWLGAGVYALATT
jgi:SAM-dependent methyltransferase